MREATPLREREEGTFVRCSECERWVVRGVLGFVRWGGVGIWFVGGVKVSLGGGVRGMRRIREGEGKGGGREREGGRKGEGEGERNGEGKGKGRGGLGKGEGGREG